MISRIRLPGDWDYSTFAVLDIVTHVAAPVGTLSEVCTALKPLSRRFLRSNGQACSIAAISLDRMSGRSATENTKKKRENVEEFKL